MATLMPMATFTEPMMTRSERIEAPGFISGLSRQSTEALAKASTRMNFDAGELVYSEGEQAEGAFVVLRGKVKLVANSSDGKALILRIAQPGEIIALSAALSERVNDTSAEAVEPTAVSFIPGAALYRLMETCGDLALRLAQELSVEYSSLCQELSTLGLQRSAMSRLAKLLVGMARNTAPQGGTVTSECPLTHEEMAQMIGTSRETVTRLLHDLRDDGIAIVKNETLTISKFDHLRALMN
jgi:CRP/FNR family transcriptional regulator, cyclic AMP receptor protein